MAKHPYLPDPLRRLVRRTGWLQRSTWALEALAVAAAWGLLRLLGPDRAVRATRAVLSRLGPRLAKSRNVRDNLAIMFPEKSGEERAALEREIWGESGALFADYAHLDRICSDGVEQRIEIDAPDALYAHVRAGRPAVFVTAHLTSFEISTWAGTRLGGRATALYQPDSNPFLDRMFLRRRAVIAADLVPREGGIRALMRELAHGKCVGLAVDSRFDVGELVPFFGIDTPTLTTPARLALHFDCPLIPVRVERITNGAHFRITFYDPVQPAAHARTRAERALDMTRQINEHFERWIRERPGQWVVLKRRWPRRTPGALPETRPTRALPARASQR